MSEPNEPLREADLPPTDLLLRDDVRRLGTLVGEILAEQVSPAFLAEVEALRVASIRRREAGAPIHDVADRLRGLPLDRAELLVRAFLSYFQAVNLAERVHRIRRRRDYQRLDEGPQPGGLEDSLRRLRDEGVPLADVLALLPRLRIEPVFTAHPTEAVRRALLDKESEVVRCLVEDIDRGLTPQERRADLERMRLALTAAWQTDETPPEKPTVADEFEHVAWYLSDVLYRVLPVFHEVFLDALAAAYGEAPAELPPVLGFGSWVGGDMDGNPNVGARTIAATLSGQRAIVLGRYRRELEKLADLLSQTEGRVGVSDALLRRTAAYAAGFPGAADAIKARHADMPYRRFLSLVAARIDATADDGEQAYAGPDELLADLRLVEASLQAHRGEHAGGFAVRRLMRRVQAFGFHLATLDLRQESTQHDAALAALLADDEFGARDWPERAQRLRDLIAGTDPVGEPDAGEARTVLDVFRTVAGALPRYGARAIGPYIISMSRSAADALAVLALARLGGCTDGNGAVPLDVAPLFETVDDLDNAADTLRSLFADPVYREHLRERGDRQVVMLGYSDSAKDGGLVASRWALQQTQVALTALAAEAGVRIAFFHGRGGSLSRGGGKTGRAVVAAPRGSVDGYLRLTEQGEVIHRKYGIRALALRNLEQASGAVLRATLRPRSPEPREAQWRRMAAQAAAAARAHYRGLVYDDPGFVPYFRDATPIDVIERLRIGSRPSKRGNAGGVSSLRAIPWVFAWSQNRCGLTAWLGVGTGLAQAIASHGHEAVAEMARDWPFFATLVDDVEMVLAKSDLDIFQHYSRLAGEPAHARYFPRIAEEFARTRDTILALKASPRLLDGDYRLRESIRLRNPYVDPISLLQVDLLARWRAAGRPEDDPLFHALVTTVNGIAAGVQNTG
ncbi:phosphoenolpyruvate carboxylase [Arenimonas caeni]|jgi:phosphoenolpyruvate carboxylase|uniref:phosphoenolpyruvate carboxylase n=1 Tax=Arenimonas caeni TaxID=2058085 RepID=UPI002A3645F8|nr:phosphoenolpyruvate carboxylase [Arenimonas caeni]MDY0023245.1 phosphoenolpyruvate carboxylase [Arenimonas caeni]